MHEPIIAYDLETTGLDPHKDSIIGLSVAFKDESLWMPILKNGGQPHTVLTDRNVVKIAHNGRFDRKFLQTHGIEILGPFEDTLLLAQMVDENQALGLKPLSQKYWGDEAIKAKLALDAELKRLKLTIKDLNNPTVDRQLVAEYCNEDTTNTFNLFYKLLEKIEKPALEYYQQEMLPLEDVLIDMELTGVKINLEALDAAEKELRQKIDTLFDALNILCSEEIMAVRRLLLKQEIEKHPRKKFEVAPVFNWNSGDQRIKLFFGQLGLGGYTKKRTPTGKYSLKGPDLKALELPDGKLKSVIQHYLNYQTYSKLMSTYIIGIKERLKGDRIHAEFLQASREQFSDADEGGTVTGRLSHRNPNLSNLPRANADYWRGAFVKDLFIPDTKDHVFLYSDYCLAGDTEIITTEGYRQIKNIKSGEKVLAKDPHNFSLAFKTVEKSACVGIAPVFRITFDDGSTVKCTADHKWLTKLGKFELTKKLKVGDRLSHVREGRCGRYPTWWMRSNREQQNCHALTGEAAYGKKPIGYHWDHINGDHLDWRASNIRPLLAKENYGQGARRWWNKASKEARKSKIKSLQKGISDHRRSYNGDGNPNFGKFKGPVLQCFTCLNWFRKPPSCNAKFCSKKCWKEAKAANHKIIKIEKMSNCKIYQITVKDWHNYVLKNGLISANSQIELRIAAHLSQDELMLDAFNNGRDLHQETADYLKKTFSFEVTRSHAKTINFAIVYGAGGYRLCQILGWPTKPDNIYKGDQISEALLRRRFPKLGSWLDKTILELRRNGKIVSMFGRTRRLPEIHDFQEWKQNHAIKQGCNFVVQSAAASVCKRAMIALHKEGFDIRDQIHDAIICQSRRNKVQLQLPKMKEIMETNIKLSVPLIVEPKVLESFLEK